jgi:biopolymer transport protein TolQ
MHSFHQIGKTGKAGLEVVAPGISEALFTTAMGLFAAIPAVIAYNFFQNKIKKVIGRMEFFASELESYLMKKIQKDKVLQEEDSEKYEI